METKISPIEGHGLLAMPDDVWEAARQKAEVIEPLARLRIVGNRHADEAALQLGISRRHVYFLIKKFREGGGLTTDLASGHSGGGRGKGRLPQPVEAVIQESVHKYFLKRQNISHAALYREIVRECRSRELPVPARNTVNRRIALLHPVEVKRKREGRDAVRTLGGSP